MYSESTTSMVEIYATGLQLQLAAEDLREEDAKTGGYAAQTERLS